MTEDWRFQDVFFARARVCHTRARQAVFAPAGFIPASAAWNGEAPRAFGTENR
jgi:hypothetical protein